MKCFSEKWLFGSLSPLLYENVSDNFQINCYIALSYEISYEISSPGKFRELGHIAKIFTYEISSPGKFRELGHIAKIFTYIRYLTW